MSKTTMPDIISAMLFDSDAEYDDVCRECAEEIKRKSPSVRLTSNLIQENWGQHDAREMLHSIVGCMLRTAVPGFNLRHGQRGDDFHTGRTVGDRWVGGRLYITLYDVPEGFPSVPELAEKLDEMSYIPITLRYSAGAT